MAKRKPQETKTINNPKSKETENTSTALLENPDVLREKILGPDNVLKQYRVPIIIGVTVLVVLVGSLTGYYYLQNTQEQNAQKEMFASVYYLESDQYQKALEGDGNYDGLLSISQNYSLGKGGELAKFYAGVALLQKGEFEKAIEYLKKFSSSDLLVQARAYSLIGDAYMELKKPGEAIEHYKKASTHKPNKFFTPGYLMKLALAYELSNKADEAHKCYDEIIEKYFDSAEVPNAKKYKAALEAKSVK